MGFFFLFANTSISVLGPTQPPMQWVPAVLTPGIKRRGVKLTTHLHLVLRSIMRGAVPSFSHYGFTVWCLIKQWILSSRRHTSLSTGTNLPLSLTTDHSLP